MTAPQVIGSPATNGIATGSGGGSELAAAVAILEGGEPTAPEGAPAPPAETPGEQKPEAPKPPEVLTEEQASERYAKVTAQERRHKQRVADQTKELNQQREALKAEQAAFKAEREKFDAILQQAKQNPLSALKAQGWTLEQLTAYVANNGVVPQDKILAELKVQQDEELKKRDLELQQIREDIAKTKRERELQIQEQQATAFETKTRGDIDALLQAEAAKFPHLSRARRARAHQGILNIIVKHYAENQEAIEGGSQKPLALSDAMLYAERDLSELWELQQDAGQAGTVQSGKPGAAKPEVAPLSQGDLSSRSVVRAKTPDDMTEEERWEEARKVLNGE